MLEFYKKLTDGRIECLVCPHSCRLAEGKTGICGVRKNTGIKIELLTYGIISGLSMDPVEKKPLYHFFPGSRILSIGSWGCNMKCDFCQNYHISQNWLTGKEESIAPAEIAKQAVKAANNSGVAYTYNEPVIWLEFIRDTALLVKEKGLYNVMVTNGFVTPEALDEYLQYIDAFNVDLKAFNEEFYRRISGADLGPVKKALRTIAESGRHLEITALVIPGLNDNADEWDEEIRWIASELGMDVPLHISRYFPMYRRSNPVTPAETLRAFHEKARKYLDYVYTGNTGRDSLQDTYCPSCGSLITTRSGYFVQNSGTLDGKCGSCGKLIYSYFTSFSS